MSGMKGNYRLYAPFTGFVLFLVLAAVMFATIGNAQPVLLIVYILTSCACLQSDTLNLQIVKLHERIKQLEEKQHD